MRERTPTTETGPRTDPWIDGPHPATRPAIASEAGADAGRVRLAIAATPKQEAV